MDAAVMKNEVASSTMAKLASMRATVRDLVVHDNESLEQVTEIGKMANEALKELERDRKSLTDPLNASLKAINAKYRKITDEIDAIKAEAKKKATAYIVAEDARKKREAEEATLKAAEALEAAGDKQAADTILTVGTEIADKTVTKGRTESGAQTVRKERWVFELTSLMHLIKAAAEHPELWAKYLDVDVTAVRAAIGAGVREIPGLTIKAETSVEFR